MKTVYKICLVNVGATLLIAALFNMNISNDLKNYSLILGTASLFIGAVNALAGLALLVFKKTKWGQGFLLSSGILLLLGFALCSQLY